MQPRTRNGSASTAFDFLATSKPAADAAGPVKMGDLVRESRAKTEDPIKLAVEEWADGKENNVRALIATLPQILWDGHEFTPISLGEVRCDMLARQDVAVSFTVSYAP